MNMRKTSKKFHDVAVGAIVLTALFLTACSKYYYNPSTQLLPQHIQKIAIRPFTNTTQQYGLEDKLTLTTQNEFNRDGRYSITTEDQADGVVAGEINRYILEPLSYDANQVPIQYKLWILVNIRFYDKIRNQTLWEEPHMSGELRYYVTSSNLPGSITEEDARQEIWDQLARDIRTRTLEGFGTVTGVSDRVAPKTSLDQYNTVAPHPELNSPPPVPREGAGTRQPSQPY